MSFKPKNDATEKGSCENGKEPAKNDLTLSVVVLTFNSERTIAACLESLVAQTVKDFNVIIVDDDSTDNTLATVDSFRASGRLNIEVLRNGTHNISNGRNIGLAAAESDLVAFLDSDDCASPDWIESASRSFNHDPQIAVLGSQRTNFGHSLLAKAISANDDIILNLFNKQKIQFGAGGCVFNKKILGDDYLFDKNFV